MGKDTKNNAAANGPGDLAEQYAPVYALAVGRAVAMMATAPTFYGSARYIGRVGALAVALGVGIAVAATPGVASATSGAECDPSSTSTGTAATTNAANTTNAKTGTTPPTTATGTATGTPSATPTVAAPTTQAQTTVATTTGPEVIFRNSGGAVTATDSVPSAVAAPPAGPGTKRPKVQRHSATTNEPPQSRVAPESTIKGTTVSVNAVKDEPQRIPTKPPAVALSATSTTAQRSVVTSAAPDRSAVTASAAPAQALASLVAMPANVISSALATLFGAVPGGPVESPALWALLAVRRFGQPQESARLTTIASEPATTSQGVESLSVMSATTMAAAAVANLPPTQVNPTTVGAPISTTGAASGSLHMADPEGHALTYTLTGLPRDGTVTLTSTTGAFTYTPTLGARLRAGASAQADADTFTVTVSDGTAANNTAVQVGVPVAPMFWITSASAPVGDGASGVAITTNRAYVANRTDNTVTVIDTTTNGVVTTIAVGTAPAAVAVNPAGTRAYVANSGAGTVSVINISTNAVIATVKVGNAPSAIAVSPGGTMVYVTNSADNSVTKISGSYNTVTGTVTNVGAAPTAITFSRDSAYVFVANAAGDSVSYFAASSTVVKTISAVGDSPSGIAPGATNNLAYVTSRDGSVALVNTTTNSVTQISAAGSHYGTAVNKAGTLLAVANGDGSVSVVDTKTNTVAQTFQAAGAAPGATPSIMFSADGNRIYVTAPANKQLRTFSLLTSVPGNSNPVALSPTFGTPNHSNGSVTGTLPASDPNGDALTFTLSGAPTKGALTVNGVGPNGFSFTYTPTAAARHVAATGAAGTTSDTFTVTISDPGGGVTTVPVVVTIDPVNTEPTTTLTVGTPSAYYGTVTGSVKGVDADGDKLTYTGSTTTAKGTVTVTSTGSFTYSPTAAARHAASATNASTLDKTYTFTITVNDGHGATVAVPVTVPISPANTAVSASASIGTPNATTGVVTGKITASDADRDALTYTATAPARGTVAINPDGTFTYTPTTTARQIARITAGADTDTFTVTVNDGHGSTKSLTLTPTIAPEVPVSQDSTAALQATFNNLKPGDTLTIAPGTYQYSDILRITVSGITIKGNGATLQSTNPAKAAVHVLANNVSLSNLNLTAPVGQPRIDHTDRVRLLLGGSGLTVSDVNVTGGTSAGVYIVNSSNFRLDRVTVSDTGSDGVQVTGGSHDGQLNNITTNRTGDDGVAVVSYESDWATVHDIVINSPVVTSNTQGRGLAVVGGERITFNNIKVSNTSGAGVYIGSYSGSVDTRSVKDVVVNGGTITGTNFTPFPFGAIKVDSRNPRQSVSNVTISNVTINNIDPEQDYNITVTVGGEAYAWYDALYATPTGTLSNIVFNNIAIVQSQNRGIIWTNSPGSYTATGFTVNGAPVTVPGSTPPVV
jgi:YVTN family beta-propeller protein/VCBS repeat-containing protein